MIFKSEINLNEFKIKDLSLAKEGREKIIWSEKNMPVLQKIKERFSKEKPLKGLKIGACLHITSETAALMNCLLNGGAEIFLAASNPLSTQDDVAAALVENGIHVYGWRGESDKDYYWCIKKVLEQKPNLIHDDGADMISFIHQTFNKNEINVFAGFEETTTGVNRLKALESENKLFFPVFAINNANTKRLFDNRYGTGQGAIFGILNGLHILLAGKTIVIAGYGWCSKGIALRASGNGAKVIITEVDPIKALEAYMDGFQVLPMEEAIKLADIVITATGCIDVVRKEHLLNAKNGVILCNSGHFDVEINKEDLNELSINKREVFPYVTEYTLHDGRKIYLLADGRLVNLVLGRGHPPEIMDLSFSLHALCAEYVIKNKDKLNLKAKVYDVPLEVDIKIAETKLSSLGIKIDTLTDKQKLYLESWKYGTR
ncbi:MAG: adenosylhomocysteinase [Nitrososphaerota archaeon]